MALLLLPACHGGSRRRQQAAVVPQPILIGTITLIDEAGKFALIDNGSNPTPPIGSTLKSYAGTVETGELITTPVRKHPFTIADLHAGQPRKGDRVLLIPAGIPVAAPVAATVAAPVATPVPAQLPSPAGGTDQ